MAEKCAEATNIPFGSELIDIECTKKEDHAGQHQGNFRSSTRGRDLGVAEGALGSDSIVNTFELKVYWGL